ncbi:MAG: type II toxin-antitoxin system RelE/ParE family toxin [Dehalococcoidia bacterium]
MPYRIETSRRAQKEVTSLSARVTEPLTRAIDGLTQEPRPRGAVKLKGTDLWRVRVGDYRAVYHIDDDHMLVTVLRVGHRREVYR